MHYGTKGNDEHYMTYYQKANIYGNEVDSYDMNLSLNKYLKTN